MEISICCPSYKRPKVKVLDYIKNIKIYIDESELKEYKKENPTFNNFVPLKKGIQGNVARVRNYILEDNKDSDVVVIIDDDINYLGYYERQTLHKMSEKELFGFIEKYTNLCNELGFKLWGVNLNSDPQCYREYSPFSTTSVILGPFCCFLKGNETRYDESLPLKEDYDIALQNLNKYRGILRVNKAHYVCEQSTNKGGCASYRNIEKEKEQLLLLQKKWGSKIVLIDKSDRSHKSKKVKKQIDYNPVIRVPIKGV